MTNQIKVTQDELQQALKLRQTFLSLTHEYGKLQFTLRQVEKQKADIEQKFDQLTDDEDKFLREVNEKYGVGNLNLDTGDFTPELK